MTCENCNTVFDEFGTWAEAEQTGRGRRCSHCGRSLQPDFIVCPYCGKTL